MGDGSVDLQPAGGGDGLFPLGHGQGQHAVLIGGGDILGLDAGDIEAAGEGAVGPLAAQVIAGAVLVLPAGAALGGDGQVVAVDVDVDVLLLHAGQVRLQDDGVAGILDVGPEAAQRIAAGEEAPLQLVQVTEGMVGVHVVGVGERNQFKHNGCLLLFFFDGPSLHPNCEQG